MDPVKHMEWNWPTEPDVPEEREDCYWSICSRQRKRVQSLYPLQRGEDREWDDQECLSGNKMEFIVQEVTLSQ